MVQKEDAVTAVAVAGDDGGCSGEARAGVRDDTVAGNDGEAWGTTRRLFAARCC